MYIVINTPDPRELLLDILDKTDYALDTFIHEDMTVENKLKIRKDREVNRAVATILRELCQSDEEYYSLVTD